MILTLKLIHIGKRGPGRALWAYIHLAIRLLITKLRSHYHGVNSDVFHDQRKKIHLHFIFFSFFSFSFFFGGWGGGGGGVGGGGGGGGVL